MEKFFKLKENGTDTRTEIVAGLTTFFTMAYIVVVNPSILALSGMSPTGVFVATVLAAACATLVMALYANVPYAQAPGMGMNAFFTFTVCFGMGYAWQEAMAMVFICGILGLLITITKIRRMIFTSIPKSLQNAIGAALGMFIAYIGFKNAGFIGFTADPGTFTVDGSGTAYINSSIVPALSAFANPGQLLALFGLVLIIVLMACKVKGAVFIGIVATTVIGIPAGVVSISGVNWFSVKTVGDVKDTAFSFFGSPGIGSLFSDPSKAFMSVCAIFAFLLSDVFDTIGTFIGTGRVSGIFDAADEKQMMQGNGINSKIEKALLADCTGTIIGSLAGTSNVTTYVESAAGIAAGGRTGLTSLTTAVLFLICLPFAGIVAIIPGQATAPALIVVGVLMMSSVAHVKWDDFEEAAPVFMTIAFTVFSYNISYGIAAGLLFYTIIKLVLRKAKDLNPIVCGATCLFILNFVVRALQDSGII